MSAMLMPYEPLHIRIARWLKANRHLLPGKEYEEENVSALEDITPKRMEELQYSAAKLQALREGLDKPTLPKETLTFRKLQKGSKIAQKLPTIVRLREQGWKFVAISARVDLSTSTCAYAYHEYRARLDAGEAGY